MLKSLTTKEAALLPSETATAETAATIEAQSRSKRVEVKNPGLKIEGRAIAQENTNCSAYYV